MREIFRTASEMDLDDARKVEVAAAACTGGFYADLVRVLVPAWMPVDRLIQDSRWGSPVAAVCCGTPHRSVFGHYMPSGPGIKHGGCYRSLLGGIPMRETKLAAIASF